MNDTTTIACTLPTPELGTRTSFIAQEILSGVAATTELEDGVELQFPGDEVWLRKLTDLIAAEHKCCTFLRIELTLLPNHGPIVLRLHGDNGTKEFLQGLFVRE